MVNLKHSSTNTHSLPLSQASYFLSYKNHKKTISQRLISFKTHRSIHCNEQRRLTIACENREQFCKLRISYTFPFCGYMKARYGKSKD